MKISFLTKFFEVNCVGLNASFWYPNIRWMLKNVSMRICVGLNAYFWCPKVHRVLKHASMRILKDARIFKFFAHQENLIFYQFF